MADIKNLPVYFMALYWGTSRLFLSGVRAVEATNLLLKTGVTASSRSIGKTDKNSDLVCSNVMRSISENEVPWKFLDLRYTSPSIGTLLL